MKAQYSITGVLAPDNTQVAGGGGVSGQPGVMKWHWASTEREEKRERRRSQKEGQVPATPVKHFL